ncbi:MAG: hypothetical protein WC532_05670 [Candidatus Omnitrophota bacterium]
MKKINLFIGIAVLSLILLVVAKDQIIRIAVEVGAKQVLGADVRIGGMSMGIFRHRIVIKDLRVYNPQDFPEGILLNIPRISVDYDLGALLQKKIYIKRLELNLKELVVIKNKKGAMNVDALKVAEKEDKPAKEQPAPQFKIDYLLLSIGQVVYKDFSTADKPKIEAFDINVKEQVYKNITNPQQLATLAITEAMRRTTIKAARIYGVASLAGVAVLPFAAALMVTGSDSVSADFDDDWDKVFTACIEAVKHVGKVVAENKTRGTISGESAGGDIAVKLEKSGNKVKATVSVRKYFLPKKEAAGGILFQVSEQLK